MPKLTKRQRIVMDRTSPSHKRIAVIWTRVSTKEQADNNLSLRTQEKACLDFAKRNDIEVDCILGNTNESAQTEGKLFREMISYVSTRKRINTILVYSMDRFSRTGPEAMVTNEYLKAKGINIVSVTQPIDTSNASGTFMENILFLFSQFENNLRKDKCISGMRACLENGYWYSAPPTGYSLDKKSKEKHKLVINDMGKILSEAFFWKAWGNVPDDEILFKIRHRGMRIREKHLKEIFSNPFYCGKIRHAFLGNRIVKGKHPPIVDEKTFLKINGGFF